VYLGVGVAVEGHVHLVLGVEAKGQTSPFRRRGGGGGTDKSV
jgi:hypothetical protein